MLTTKNVSATIAVKDLKKSALFYEDILGFKRTEFEPEVYASYQSGGANFLVYQSKFAGGYKATVATWWADNDVESIVKDLKARGLTFEHYDDMPDTTRKGDVHYAGDMANAWFKDPDGNILCVVGTAN